MSTPKKRRRLILDIVKNQIRAGTPPETKQTLDRLVKQGYSKNEATELIAYVVASEIFDSLKKQQPFDESRFVKALTHCLIFQNDRPF